MSKSVLVDRDRLMNADRTEVARTTVNIFSRIEAFRKERQLLALAAAFLLMCDACRVPAQDVFTAATNLMANPIKAEAHANPLAPQFAAMKFHLETDVLVKE